MKNLVRRLLPQCWRYLVSMPAAAIVFGIPLQAGILFNYPDFSSTAGLTMVGSVSTPTTSDGTVLRVTPAATFVAGAAYSTTGVPLGPQDTFSTTFDFR